MKKKIAFVGNSSLTMINFRLGVIVELSKLYEMVIITPEDSDVEILHRYGIRFIPIDVDCRGTNPLKDWQLLQTLIRLYREEKFDFVFHYTIKPIVYASIAAQRTGIPYIPVITGLGYTFLRRNWLFLVSALLHKYALKNAEQVWFLNQSDYDFFVRHRLVDMKRAEVIHGEGVNINKFVPSGEHPKKFTFLYFGRMLRTKGIEHYVEAARRLQAQYPEAEWQMLGPLDSLNPDAIAPREMEEWVQKGYVKYKGVSHDVRPYLAACSCVVLPTYYMEGVPRSLMEAAAMGVPLIATDQAGCTDVVIDGENGYLCRLRDTESLMQAMQRMLKLSASQLQDMGRKGRQLMVEHFDEKIVIQRYKQTLKNQFDKC